MSGLGTAIAVIGCVVFLSGCGSASSDSTTSASTAAPAAASFAPAAAESGYVVGPLDVLQITVFNVPELSMKEVQVADTGTINLPLLGEVPVAGKTAQQIERELAARLGAKYLKNPQVTVFVRKNNSQVVTIEGAVIKPGLYPISGRMTMIQLVAMAGGLNNDLYAKDVTVFRNVNGRRTSRVVDIDAIRAGQAPDIVLEKGDVVVVGTSSSKMAMQNTLKVIPGAASLGATAATIAILH